MSIMTHINTINDYGYLSYEYIRNIQDHRDIIISQSEYVTLDPVKETNQFRARLHGYLLKKGYRADYHLAIIVLNSFDTQLDFGGKLVLSTKNNTIGTSVGTDVDNIVGIYLPSITTLDKYMTKTKNN